MKKVKKKFKKTVSLILAMCFALSCAFHIVIPVEAAVSYQGQGTVESPYLVETAEQLDGIRNNLSAHYKLANTIDLSSFGTFSPIGYQGEPFTGSLTCDKDSDGTPLYAIKNLKVYNAAGERAGHKPHPSEGSYVDFSSGRNKWQAGLFGFTNGATITNIAILDANITNTVIGQHGQGGTNPGQNDESQSTGVLIGSAVDTNISGCVTTGVINSKSNQCGGLAGMVIRGSVVDSYSTVDVTSTGLWTTGGLIGLVQDGSISTCFATGNVSGNAVGDTGTVGGLIGQVEEGYSIMIVSCYSTGSVKNTGDGSCYSLIGFRLPEFVPEVIQNVINCYTTSTTSTVGTQRKEVNAPVTGNSNYRLSSANVMQDGFSVGTMDEIKNALAGSGDYDISGSAPTLQTVAIVTDVSKYVPGAVSSETTNDDNTSTESTEQEGVKVSVDEVVAMIEALPAADEVTIEHKDAVKAAKRAYDSLSEDEQLGVSTEHYVHLMEVFNQAVILILEQLTDGILALPKAKKLTVDDYETVMALYDDYEFVGEEYQAYILEDVKAKLMEAVETVKKLKDGGGQPIDANAISPIELAFIIVLSILILLVLAFNVIWSVSIIKKNRQLLGELKGEERGKNNESKME